MSEVYIKTFVEVRLALNDDVNVGPGDGSPFGYQNNPQNRGARSGAPAVRASAMLEVVMKAASGQACTTGPMLEHMWFYVITSL